MNHKSQHTIKNIANWLLKCEPTDFMLYVNALVVAGVDDPLIIEALRT